MKGGGISFVGRRYYYQSQLQLHKGFIFYNTEFACCEENIYVAKHCDSHVSEGDGPKLIFYAQG
jgi:hypothetical protein